MDRSQEIIRTSWIGITAYMLLAGFKAAVGILASSVAIVMDAVNNLSDAHRQPTCPPVCYLYSHLLCESI